MARILAVANQKGGVGKTTTAVNLAASMAKTNRSIMLIDLDPQGNATVGCGIQKDEIDKSIYQVLSNEAGIREAGKQVDNNLVVVPSSPDLAGISMELASEFAREMRLKNALSLVQEKYDYIFMDCPPALDLLTVNALVAATGVLIPLQCEYYALEGLTSLLNTVNRIKEILNPRLQIEGLLRTMFDSRVTLSNEVSDQLLEHFGDKVFRTVIPRNVRLAEAPSHGQAVIDYDRNCAGAQAYLALAGEMLRRNETEKNEEIETWTGT
ncbi:MAG: ParA family protein [Gammaproteobacteria bacterium]|nr:ParA family protein [Gammaproteobacteria bacterium]